MKPRSSIKKKNFLITIFKSIYFFIKNKESYLISNLTNLITKCYKFKIISSEQKLMLSNILKINSTKVGDIMVPRSNITAIEEADDLSKIKKIILDKEHSRMPIYRKNLDHIIGFIHSKDLVQFLQNDKIIFKIEDVTRKILYAPHSMKITNLLVKMRSSAVHIAIVLDEYGGTDGVITIEDIIEEIVGEIQDEHDGLDNNIYLTKKQISDNVYHFGGRVDIEDAEKMIGQEIILDENGENDFETIGGFMFYALKKIPQTGEAIKKNNLSFKILDSDSKSIKLIEIAILAS